MQLNSRKINDPVKKWAKEQALIKEKRTPRAYFKMLLSPSTCCKYQGVFFPVYQETLLGFLDIKLTKVWAFPRDWPFRIFYLSGQSILGLHQFTVSASVFLSVTDLSNYFCFFIFSSLLSFQGNSLPCDLSSLMILNVVNFHFVPQFFLF